ncbi:aminoacyl-tRNA hydrolase [Methylopila turkensis]|uniref:Peptidyl-tRNA hydrolase n=1 Tax=Methylopila turkensis TaxID=1437816 RepID=A0A9W6JPJ3_9HYPH|nr:aminoacyl-tRNA hydrolase [Methylopila turkensis]GLK79253.1 peptidyl-tRNA hydrolase [Methylopila turkensis]
MLLLVGLGNPGPKYEKNRHNIGFMAVDRIASRHGFGPWRARFQGEAAEGAIGGVKALLLKPRTYMNESGRSVAEAARFFKIPAADIVALHDELDLAPGKLRVKTGGGNAGHNGLRSITAHMGNDYRRVRLGIGHPGDKALVHSYVLNDFAKSETPWVDVLTEAVADAADLLAKAEDASFQNKVHLRMEAAGFGEVAKVGGARG